MWNFSGTPWGGTWLSPGQTMSWISSPWLSVSHDLQAPIFSHWSCILDPSTPLLRFMILSSTFLIVPALVNRTSGLPVTALDWDPAMYLAKAMNTSDIQKVCLLNTCKICPLATILSPGRSWTQPCKIIWETAAPPETERKLRQENFSYRRETICWKTKRGCKCTWFVGTLRKSSTASANTAKADGIWSIRAADEVSKLTPAPTQNLSTLQR